MSKWIEHGDVHQVSSNVDAHWSPDDQGWYLQDYETDKIGSPIRHSLAVWPELNDARKAFAEGKVTWS